MGVSWATGVTVPTLVGGRTAVWRKSETIGPHGASEEGLFTSMSFGGKALSFPTLDAIATNI